MSNCTTARFSGLSDFKSFLEKMNGASLQNKGVTSTMTEALSLDAWHLLLASSSPPPNGIKAIMLPVSSFVKTTDEMEIITTPLGKKVSGSKSIPSGILYLDASLCDYQTLYNMAGTPFEFVPYFQGNTFWMTKQADGSFKGLRCYIDTMADFTPDDKTQSYPVYLFFDDYSEFENISVFSGYNFTPKTLEDLTPVGLNVQTVIPYATGGNVSVKVTKRCSNEPETDLVLPTNWPIITTNGTGLVAVTAVDTAGAAQGNYVLTIQQDTDTTPADLGAGQYATLQAQVDDATYITYMSDLFTVNGV
jgi:hypothetical protein